MRGEQNPTLVYNQSVIWQYYNSKWLGIRPRCRQLVTVLFHVPPVTQILMPWPDKVINRWIMNEYSCICQRVGLNMTAGRKWAQGASRQRHQNFFVNRQDKVKGQRKINLGPWYYPRWIAIPIWLCEWWQAHRSCLLLLYFFIAEGLSA